MKNLKSTEALFLASVLEGQPKPKHPILGVLFGQLRTLIELVDGNETYQVKVCEILNFIKKNWNGN